MKKSLGLLFTATLAACGGNSSEKPTNLLKSNDFESYQGWVNDLPLTALTREKAHSGHFSTKVMPGQDYSLGFSDELSRLSPSRPKKIKVSAWVLAPSAEAATRFVVTMQNPNTPSPLLYESIDLKELKGFNQWQQVEKVITVPAEASPTTRMQVYLWRADSPQPSYLDDIEISLAE